MNMSHTNLYKQIDELITLSILKDGSNSTVTPVKPMIRGQITEFEPTIYSASAGG